MICRRCGNELPDDSQLCQRCGTPVDGGGAEAAPTSRETPVAPATGGAVVIPNAIGDLLDSFTSPRRFWDYWRAPAVAGCGAVAVVYVFSLLVMGALYAVFRRDDDSPVPLGPVGFILKGAGLVSGAFHGSALRLRGPGAETLRVVAIPLTGLVVVGVVLLLAARWAARHHDGTPGQRLFAGIRTALPYAAVATVLSTFTTIVDGKQTNDYFFAELSNRDVLGYALLWGLLFGWAGGALATRRFGLPSVVAWLDARVPGAKAALEAGARGLVGAAVVTVLGLLAAAVVYFGLNPGDFGEVFSSVRKSLATVLALVMFLPNYVAVAFVAAMGGTIVSGHESIGIFGASPDAGVTIPAYWWTALLVPLIATVAMGFMAARRSEPDPRHAFRGALLAVVPFAAGIWLVSLVAGVSGFTRTFTSESPFGLGSSPAAVFFLPVIWGLAGSSLGALLYLRKAGLAVTSGPAAGAATSTAAAPTPAPQVETPPVETPPETPPVETPPVETPPVETPPVETPPVETPPVETAPQRSAPAEARCPRCGAGVTLGARFCETCGHDLAKRLD